MCQSQTMNEKKIRNCVDEGDRKSPLYTILLLKEDKNNFLTPTFCYYFEQNSKFCKMKF